MNLSSTSPMPAWPTVDVSLQYKVRLGLWTNWSRGSVLGKTLTLGRQEGNLLIAFTGVFITYVGARFWQIASLSLHRCYSTPQAREALYHQRQIILRNASSADATFIDAIQLHFAWRRGRRFLWLFPTLLTSLFCIIAFTVAGGFSSQIATSVNTEVLLDGTDCSKYNLFIGSNNTAALYDSWVGEEASNALNYVQQCYSANSSGLIDCASFVKERLPSIIDTTAGCPFSNNICRSNSSNLVLDTGYLDSHEDFGINAPLDQRILVRRVLSCAPLTTTGRATNISDGVLGNRTGYSYGSSQENGTVIQNFTYVVNSLKSQYAVDENTPNDQPYFTSEYIISTSIAEILNGKADPQIGTFLLDPDLSRSDADVNLIFLSGNGVVFSYPTDDLWYRVTTPFVDYWTGGVSGSNQGYGFDVAASPLACAEQWQYCRSNTSSCGPLASSADALIGVFPLFGIESGIDDLLDGSYDTSNNSYASRFKWFADIIYGYPSYIGDLTGAVGPRALLSSQTLESGVQNALLPSNQWQLDLTYIWASLLAMQQAFFVEIAHGSSLDLPKVLPSNDAQKAICQNQKIQTTAYTSFSFFALLFIYIIGCFIIIISFSLDPLLGFLQRRYDYKAFADLEWRVNTALQLHRLAHEDLHGDDIWKNCNNTVPTTGPGVILPALDINNKKHPRLPATSTSSQSATQVARSITTNSRSHTPTMHSEPADDVETAPESTGSSINNNLANSTFQMKRRTTL